MSVVYLNAATEKHDAMSLASPALALTPRCFNLLRRGGYRTIEEVEQASDPELRAILSMRESDLAAIRDAIEVYRRVQARAAAATHPAFRRNVEW
ncbi:hypothetical protein [Nocardioides pakistanensis]